MSSDDDCNSIVELNVGGVVYTTTSTTLKGGDETSVLKTSLDNFLRDSSNRVFIDRDGALFRYVLDYLRTRTLILPENFAERRRLKAEADYYKLPALAKLVDGIDLDASVSSSSSLCVGSPPVTPTNNVIVSPAPPFKTRKQVGLQTLKGICRVLRTNIENIP